VALLDSKGGLGSNQRVARRKNQQRSLPYYCYFGQKHKNTSLVIYNTQRIW